MKFKLEHIPIQYLHNVVLGNGANDPRVVRVPGEVRNLGRVTSVNKEKLWGAILGILSALFLANFGQVPNVKAPVERIIKFQTII